MIDYYKLLNVSINASDEDIRKGYYKMIKRWHPDVNNTDKNLAEIMARQINEAYGILSNPGILLNFNIFTLCGFNVFYIYLLYDVYSYFYN